MRQSLRFIRLGFAFGGLTMMTVFFQNCGRGYESLEQNFEGRSGQSFGIRGLSTGKSLSNSPLGSLSILDLPQAARLSELAQSGQDLIIPADTLVMIDQSVTIGTLEIRGRLICPSTGDYTITTQGIVISGTGAAFECGTEESRFQGNLTIALRDGKPVAGAMRSFVVMNSGSLNLFGRSKNLSWMHLAENAAAGSNSIRVDQAIDWSVGDEIAIAPTGYDASEAESVRIAAVDASTNTIQLASSLKSFHWGSAISYSLPGKTYNVEERAEVANLSRNIRIMAEGSTESLNSLGGHVMVMKGASAKVDAVEFFHMGRMGEMMRYPFHWHRAGDVTGQFIRNSSIHESFQRCIVVHGTNKAAVENNVCFNFYGHGFFLEDGNEIENSIRDNLAIFARKPLPDRQLLQSDIDESNPLRWKGPSAFWVSNPNNALYGNVAAGSEGTGFWMSFEPAAFCPSDDSCRVSQPEQANVFPAKAGTLGFSNNTAHAARVGFTWDGAQDVNQPLANPRNPNDHAISISHYHPGGIPVFSNIRASKNISGVYVRADTMEFRNSVFADNTISLFFAFNQIYREGAIVGMTPNFDMDRDFGYLFSKAGFPDVFVGAWLYDGGFEMENVDFFGFGTSYQSRWGKEYTPIPFKNLGGDNRYVSRVKGLRFSPEPIERVRFYNSGLIDGVTSTMIRDLDGSLGGRPNTIVMAAHKFDDIKFDDASATLINNVDVMQSINYDSSCTTAPGIPAGLVCDGQRGLLYMHAYDDGGDGYRIPFNIIRNDGQRAFSSANYVEQLLASSPYSQNEKFGVTLDKGFEYTVDFADAYAAATQNKNFMIAFQSETIGQTSPLLRFARMGANCRVSDLPPMGSIEQLRGSATGYFSVGDDVYVKMRTTYQAPIFLSPTAAGATTDRSYIKCDGLGPSKNSTVTVPVPPSGRDSSPVAGYVGAPEIRDGNVVIPGWTCMLGKAESIKVHIYLGGPSGGGQMLGEYPANVSSEDAVGNSCLSPGKNFRFSIALSSEQWKAFSGKSIYAYGISSLGRNNNQLGNSGQYQIPDSSAAPSGSAEIIGNLDGVVLVDNRVTLNGWTCVRGQPDAIKVHVYLGGPSGGGVGGGQMIGEYSANVSSEAAVADVCHSVGTTYRFSIALTDDQQPAFAGQPIYVYGISNTPGSYAQLANSGIQKVPVIQEASASKDKLRVGPTTVPSGSVDDSLTTPMIAPQGFFKVNGADPIYNSDGTQLYCHIANPTDFAALGGRSDLGNVKVYAGLPTQMTSTGDCPSPPIVQGFFQVVGQDAISYSNGIDAFCALTQWEDFLAVGGQPDGSNVQKVFGLPQMRNDGACNINDVSVAVTNSTSPAAPVTAKSGFFKVIPYADIYMTTNSAIYCKLSSSTDYLAAGGRADQANVVVYNAFPLGMVNTGTCGTNSVSAAAIFIGQRSDAGSSDSSPSGSTETASAGPSAFLGTGDAPPTNSTRSIYRFHESGTNFHRTALTASGLTSSWVSDGVIGHYYRVTTSTRRALYACLVQTASFSYFTSVDPACEGQSSLGIIGYVEKKKTLSASQTVYRCVNRGTNDHLDTLTASECTNNGYDIEAIMGYAH